MQQELIIHPAFTFGNDELDGIWVGKFETTVSPSSACVVNHNEEDCKDVDPSILPNISSLRLQQVVHQFATSLKFKSPVYGIKSNSHMMKDSEWGAVAYLSHSIYGIKTDIRINNAYGYITGCGASFDDSDYVTSCQIKYGNASDYPQSTTGNISGIFDMSGGAMERMMANYNNNLNCSGLTSMPDLKYYNLYTVLEYNSSNSKGFATYETQGWYSDSYEVIDTYWDWVYRGGDLWDKETAGLFNTFHSNGGYNNGHDTFRLTISPGA